MSLSTFLGDIAKAQGADSLHGAMVFVMMDRPLDHMIVNALGLGAYHPGSPGRWSHCFLLAEPFRGPDTAILDCTIRDSAGGIVWDADLRESIEIVLGSTVGGGAGGVYASRVADYDVPRVTDRGVRWLPGLAAASRTAIVASAQKLRAEGYAYDFPGLLRELVRLLTGIAIPGAPRRLFCSAFAQAAYRDALGTAGDFAPRLRTEDVTPDDLWYSRAGVGLADDARAPSVALPSASATSLLGALASAPAAPAPPRAPAVPPAVVAVSAPAAVVASPAPVSALEAELVRAIRLVGSRADLPRRDEMLDVLGRARAQLHRGGDGVLEQSDAVTHRDEFALALVKSAITGGETVVSPAARLTGADILAGGQYSDLDPGWLATFFNRLFRARVSFPVPPVGASLVTEVDDDVTIAMAGDWATGDASSRLIGSLIARENAAYTIHLGDVYYSGTESEERERLVAVWPAGTKGSFTLNSNHEMYSGGHGYFQVALADPKFRAQAGVSYFALEHKRAFVVGIDSAYFASDFMYQKGKLAEPMLGWLSDLATRARAEAKSILLLSHHNGLTYDGMTVEPLWSQVLDALNGGPDYWYWGHVHGAAVFDTVRPRGIEINGRCLGHGGVPYSPDVRTRSLLWTESRLAGDSNVPQRALNGYVVLKLTPQGLNETYMDEHGGTAWSAATPWKAGPRVGVVPQPDRNGGQPSSVRN